MQRRSAGHFGVLGSRPKKVAAVMVLLLMTASTACSGGSVATASLESAERGASGVDRLDPDVFGTDGFDPDASDDFGRPMPERDPDAPVPGIDTSLQNPSPLGTPRDVGDGWTVTVEGFDPAADAAVEQASDFYQPPSEGSTYAVLKVSGTYNGDGPGSPMDLDFELATRSGVVHGSDFMCSLPDEWLFLDDTPKGSTTTGSVCFQVPVAEVDSVVLVVTPFFDFDGARTFMALR